MAQSMNEHKKSKERIVLETLKVGEHMTLDYRQPGRNPYYAIASLIKDFNKTDKKAIMRTQNHKLKIYRIK